MLLVAADETLFGVPVDAVFMLTAGVGTALFLVQSAAHMISGDGANHGMADYADSGGGPDASDGAFKWLNLQAISAFLMMFGLVGWALRWDNGLGIGVSFLGAFLGGAFAVWVVTRIFALMGKLQSSGTLDMNAAAGSRGTVHQRVRGHSGKVQVVVRQRLITLDACTEEGVTLETGTPIEVVEVVNDGLVRVRASHEGKYS